VIAEQVINGLVLGSMYALIAIGYSLVFGVLDKLTFAHSEIFMFGGYVGVLAVALGLPIWWAIPLAIVVAGLQGLFVEFVSFRKFTTADGHITAALSSFAVGIVLIDLTQKVWGSDPKDLGIPSSIYTAGTGVFGFHVVWIKLAILVATLLIMVALQLVIANSRMGRNIRAVAESPLSAALLGIDVKRVTQQTFFIASALAGLAGLMLAMRGGFADSNVGLSFGLKALAIMAIGGMGDVRGAMIGGLLIGVLEGLAFQFGLGKLSEVLVWVLMIAVLLVRPSGLFGRAVTREMRA
jgi:branched-chain amino acid transport system permease protein